MALDEKRLFRQSFDALNPGGWLEIQEVVSPVVCSDGTLEGTSLLKWNDLIMKAAAMIGTPLDKPLHYRQWMEEAGFVNVKEYIVPLPLKSVAERSKAEGVGHVGDDKSASGDRRLQCGFVYKDSPVVPPRT
jgi:hypothetical protein